MASRDVISCFKARRATAAEAGVLVKFNVAMAHETENRQLDASTVQRGVAAMFDGRGDGFYVVAEVTTGPAASEIAGALMVTREWSDWRDGYFLWIQSVYVRPDYRRRGVFRELFQYLRAEAEARDDVCGLRLYVEQENAIAQETYGALMMQKTPYLMYELELTPRT